MTPFLKTRTLLIPTVHTMNVYLNLGTILCTYRTFKLIIDNSMSLISKIKLCYAFLFVKTNQFKKKIK